MKITGLLIDVESNPGKVKEVEIEENNLSEFYSVLGCSTIDVVLKKIRNKVFDIVCDDEGLLRENPIVSAISENGKYMLVGNLFVCNHYKDRLVSLSNEDIKHILENVSIVASVPVGKKEISVHPMLLNVSDV